MNIDQPIGHVLQAVADLDIDGVAARVREALRAGAEPRAVLNDGLSAGMHVVGERFEAGEYYLTELVLAGEVMKAGLVPLEPLLETTDVQGKGTVVLATVEGDIHEIGRNLVGTMLQAAGFQVVDLGVDVPAACIVAAVREYGADVVGLSVLLTPMVGQLQAVVEALTETGCDAHGADAVAAVRICEELLADNTTAD
jgi:methanogenic corrinoid protein MtbC1